MKKMTNASYTEKEIEWAKTELRKKGVENPTQEQAIKLLDTFKEFGKVVVDKVDEDKKSKIN